MQKISSHKISKARLANLRIRSETALTLTKREAVNNFIFLRSALFVDFRRLSLIHRSIFLTGRIWRGIGNHSSTNVSVPKSSSKTSKTSKYRNIQSKIKDDLRRDKSLFRQKRNSLSDVFQTQKPKRSCLRCLFLCPFRGVFC